MSDRSKPHNGRDLDGHFKVKQADVEDAMDSPDGTDVIRDDVRLGGAVEDTGPHAGESGRKIERLVADNREDVDRSTGGTR